MRETELRHTLNSGFLNHWEAARKISKGRDRHSGWSVRMDRECQSMGGFSIMSWVASFISHSLDRPEVRSLPFHLRIQDDPPQTKGLTSIQGQSLQLSTPAKYKPWQRGQ